MLKTTFVILCNLKLELSGSSSPALLNLFHSKPLGQGQEEESFSKRIPIKTDSTRMEWKILTPKLVSRIALLSFDLCLPNFFNTP